jgi:hypothetical protein
MSTPKKIRATYESTFRKLISTSPASKRFRQFLSSLRSPTQTFNLPITLADVRPRLLVVSTKAVKATKISKAAKKPVKRKPIKAAAKKSTKTTVKKTTKKAVKKAPARRRTSKK